MSDNAGLLQPQNRLSSLIRRAARPGGLARAARTTTGVDPPRILFAATGGSGARSAVGHELYRNEPVFRASIEACSDVLEASLGYRSVEAFRSSSEPVAGARDNRYNYRLGDGPHPEGEQLRRLRRDELVLLGLIQIAWCDLWRSVDVAPDATIGISLGEVGAAYAAGALSRDDAAVVVAAVANAVSDSTDAGVMFTVEMDGRTARSLCVRAPGELELLGAVDLKRCLVLTTQRDAPAVREFLMRECSIMGEYVTDWAYHTERGTAGPQQMAQALSAITPRPPTCPVYSAAAGGVLADARFDAAHWHWVLSRPFFYDGAAGAALVDGVGVAISIGVHPEQAVALQSIAGQLGHSLRSIDSMRNDEPELTTWRRARQEARELRIVGTPGPQITHRAAARVEDLDLSDPRTAQNPFVHYDDLRREGPVHFLPRQDSWIVLGYEEVREAFRQPRLYSSRLMASVDPVLLGADGPAHAALRRGLAPSLSPAAVDGLAGEVDAVAQRLLVPLLSGRDFDVVTDFAAPLAEFVAARVLELDDVSAGQLVVAVGDSEIETVALFARLGSSMAPLVDGSGLAGDLRRRCALDDTQLRAVLRTLWIAATSTTKRVITSSIRLLAEQPALRAQLIAEPGLLDAFIGESIRLHPPELLIGRVTTRPVTLGGQQIPQGSIVQLCIGAANRDPVHFPDPDQVRLDRNQEHLAFGRGAHGCPGAGLGRAEARIALGALLRIAPSFALAQPTCMMRYVPSSTTHGLEQLVINRGRLSV